MNTERDCKTTQTPQWSGQKCAKQSEEQQNKKGESG